MQDLTFTPATIILMAVIVLLVGLAIHRLWKRGMCDCGDHCDKCSKACSFNHSLPCATMTSAGLRQSELCKIAVCPRKSRGRGFLGKDVDVS